MAEGWTLRLNRRSSGSPFCRGRSSVSSRRNSDTSNHLSNADRSVSRERMPVSCGYSRIPCRFFQRGFCAFGENCKFLHSSSPESRVSFGRKENAGIRESSHNTNMDTPTTSSALTGNEVSLRQDARKISPLKKQETSADSGLGDDATESWVNAPEFIPSACGTMGSSVNASENAIANMNKNRDAHTNSNENSKPSPKPPKSYAAAVGANTKSTTTTTTVQAESADKKFCPYMEMSGHCEYGSECPYIHGDVCEFCGKACLHPTDEEQRKLHHNECIKQHEMDMELSFAVARSKDKICGVCMEVVMEKSPGEQRFGILTNCNHCFCLTCIRKWRQAKQFDNKIIRACPECRVTSDFVCPSVYWVDTKEDKDKLIQEYKCALSVKNCKYFNSGSGKCPFGNKCFYLHAYPDGTKADVGPPPRQRRQNADGELEVLQQIILWDYLEERDNRLMMIDDLEDFVAFISDSDESDWSEYDIFFD